MEDTGSWVLQSRTLNPYTLEATESWYGLSHDRNKIPNTGATGSRAYCIDTHEFYMYDKSTNTWYLQSSDIKDGTSAEKGYSETSNDSGGITVTIADSK